MARDVMTREKRRSSATRRRNNRLGLGFASPYLLGFAIFTLVPIVLSAYYSFTDFNLFQSPTWVGLGNYAKLMADEKFWKALANTGLLTLFGVPLTIAISVVSALVLNFPVKGQPVFRALVYLPTIVPAVVGGYLWRWLLNAQYGFINYFLGLVHLPQPAWLTEPQWGKPAIVLMALWTIGGTVIIYLAALQDVPKDLYEAAQLDGAGPWRRFWSITWPQLSPITLFQTVTSVFAYLQIFTQPFLLTQTASVGSSNSGGGPGNSMLTYAVYLFTSAFSDLKMGYASAMAWILFLITLAVTGILLWGSKRWVHYDN